MNEFEKIAELVSSLLPLVESGVSFFVHNKNSQQKFQVVAGDVNTVAAVATAIAQKNAASTAASGK